MTESVRKCSPKIRPQSKITKQRSSPKCEQIKRTEQETEEMGGEKRAELIRERSLFQVRYRRE